MSERDPSVDLTMPADAPVFAVWCTSVTPPERTHDERLTFPAAEDKLQIMRRRDRIAQGGFHFEIRPFESSGIYSGCPSCRQPLGASARCATCVEALAKVSLENVFQGKPVGARPPLFLPRTTRDGLPLVPATLGVPERGALLFMTDDGTQLQPALRHHDGRIEQIVVLPTPPPDSSGDLPMSPAQVLAALRAMSDADRAKLKSQFLEGHCPGCWCALRGPNDVCHCDNDE